MAKRFLFASAFLSTILVVAPQAFAGERPPPNPSIAQYVEVMPTSGGPEVPSGRARARLSKRVATELPKGAEGTLLREFASAAAYGAPQKKLRSGKRAAVEARRAVVEPRSAVSGATFGAAADAVGAKQSVVLWLGLALLAITALGVSAAVGRARR